MMNLLKLNIKFHFNLFMDILSTFNLFNKRNNLHRRVKNTDDPRKINMKTLEEKLFFLSSDRISKTKSLSPAALNNSKLDLNEQFEKCLPDKSNIKMPSKAKKISLSTAILKFDMKKMGKSQSFLPSIFDDKRSPQKQIVFDSLRFKNRVKNQMIIKKSKNENILIEENNLKPEEAKKSVLHVEFKEKNCDPKKSKDKQNKSKFNNSKYFKNQKNNNENNKKYNLSFPNLNMLLISLPLKNEVQSMKKKTETKSKNRKIKTNEEDLKINSLILLSGNKKPKYRDEEKQTEGNKKIIV